MKYIFSVKKLIFLSANTVFFVLPLVIFAEIVDIQPYTLEVPIGNIYVVNGIIDYMVKIYTIGISLASIFAVVAIMFGGMRWAASAGNEQAISGAKEMITGAIIGLIIALASFGILRKINPALVEFQTLAIEKIEVDPIKSGCGEICSNDDHCKECNNGKAFCFSLDHKCYPYGDIPLNTICTKVYNGVAEETCKEPYQCKGKDTSVTSGTEMGVCSDGEEGSFCDATDVGGDFCKEGTECKETAEDYFICTSNSGAKNGTPCTENADCLSKLCMDPTMGNTGTCISGDGSDGMPCKGQDENCKCNYYCPGSVADGSFCTLKIAERMPCSGRISGNHECESGDCVKQDDDSLLCEGDVDLGCDEDGNN